MSDVKLFKILKKVHEFMDSARDSLRDDHFEAVINRAYYAIFHSIQALLLIEGIDTKTHVGAHNKFREIFIKTHRLDSSLSQFLRRSFDKRQFGDYDYDDVSKDQAEESLTDAEQFTSAVIQYLKQNNHLK